MREGPLFLLWFLVEGLKVEAYAKEVWGGKNGVEVRSKKCYQVGRRWRMRVTEKEGQGL